MSGGAAAEAPKKSAMEQVASWVQYAGMAIAMVGGATWPAPRVSVVLAGIAVLGVGIVLARRARSSVALQESASGSGDVVTLAKERIAEAIGRVKALQEKGAEATLEAIATEAESVVNQCVFAVANSQERFARDRGFANYATVMTPLASAERWLNRAWSAASDGHREEAQRSLEESLQWLSDALSAANELRK